MLWIDGVGGYLVCLSDLVRIGQAVAGSPVEVPIVGDLSRQHASFHRQGDGYILEPHAPTWVGSRPATGRRNLTDGDEVRLGHSFALRFRQPHPLSASARLDFLSHHRTQPAADGVLLMAGSCILGPTMGNHVVCRGWDHEVVLVRQGQTLACHAVVPLEVDGKPYQGRAPVTLDSRIQGDDFCVTLERID
jgi:hypothetical protein